MSMQPKSLVKCDGECEVDIIGSFKFKEFDRSAFAFTMMESSLTLQLLLSRLLLLLYCLLFFFLRFELSSLLLL